MRRFVCAAIPVLPVAASLVAHGFLNLSLPETALVFALTFVAAIGLGKLLDG